MRLFKDMKVYTIVADKVTKDEVQKFVSEYHTRLRKPYMINATEYMLIDLRTTEERNVVIELIKSRFKQKFKVKIGEKLIWITSS